MSTAYLKFANNHRFFLHLNITRFRRERGWTQERFAEEVEISVGHLARLEAPYSDAEPSFALLCRIAFTLGVEVADLVRVDPELIW
ncbi:MAG: helix-turn-helix transcriptional regulator [Clostridiales bacterium]|nr:helix-turn-helix transcriptional regulator [Clostridiales bacterium]